MDMDKQLTGLWTIMSYIIRKLLFSNRIYITLLVTMLVVAIELYATTRDVDRLVNGVDHLDLLILSFFLPIMAMIYGSSLVRDEIDDRSITQIVTSPLDRVLTFTGYYIGLAISVSLIVLLILTAGFLSFFGVLGIDSDTIGIYGSMAAMVLIGSFAYSSLFIMVSVLTSYPMYFGLVYAFIWEGFIGSLPGNIRLLSVKHYVRSLGTDWINQGGISTYDATSFGDAAIVLVVFSVVVFILGAIIFRQKEFP